MPITPIRVFGYHGTTAEAADQILSEGFLPSENKYDWLGRGVYFFQDAPRRAWEWADVGAARRGTEPAVIRAEILLGDCMDLLDIQWVETLSLAYAGYKRQLRRIRERLPRQTKGAHRLDCAVIDYAVDVSERQGEPIRTVRGIFVEGKRIFPRSHLYDRAHVQIAVRDLALIADPQPQERG